MTNFDQFKMKNRALQNDPEFIAVLKKHGYVLTSMGGSFDSNNIKNKITLAVRDVSPAAQAALASPENSPMAMKFKLYAASVGLKPEYLGKVFQAKGRRLEIIGFNPSKPKNCIMLKDVASGSMGWQCPPETAITGLRRAGLL